MTRDLNQIFPPGYPQIPTVEDLQFEVRDMLCHCETANTILHYLQQIECPYYQEALTIQTQKSWHDMERERKEPAVYLDMEGIWHYSWIDIDAALRTIIKRAHALQVDLEMAKQDFTSSENPTHDELPQKHPSSEAKPSTYIRHVDVMYNNCTIYQSTSPLQVPTDHVAEPADNSVASPIGPSFYRTHAQAVTTIEKRFAEAMSFATKTKCIRFLLQHSRKDGCFDFSNMTNQERADALNKVQDKHHFTAGDFENAVHRPSPK